MQPVERYVYTSLGMYPRDADPPSATHWVQYEDYARLERELLGVKRELHRWRTGTQIEGDCVGPQDPDERDGCE